MQQVGEGASSLMWGNALSLQCKSSEADKGEFCTIWFGRRGKASRTGKLRGWEGPLNGLTISNKQRWEKRDLRRGREQSRPQDKKVSLMGTTPERRTRKRLFYGKKRRHAEDLGGAHIRTTKNQNRKC